MTLIVLVKEPALTGDGVKAHPTVHLTLVPLMRQNIVLELTSVILILIVLVKGLVLIGNGVKAQTSVLRRNTTLVTLMRQSIV